MKRVFSVIMTLILVLGLTGAFPAIAAADPEIIYVDADATGVNDGSSWQDAIADLQDALSAAGSGEEIRVAQGTYYPGTERMDSFSMKNGVTINGGYAGYGEIDPDARDIDTYETILSGDIGTPGDSSDNSYHVFYHPDGTNLDNSAVLDGCIITGGNADGENEHESGGGMHNNASSPVLTDCTFFRNFAGKNGGAVANIDSSPEITSCIFERNGSDRTGGGLYNESSYPSVIGCTFISNNATVSGGGVHNNNTSSPIITDCIFDSNAAFGGGGMANHNNSSPVITGCRFTNSYAGNGSAMANFSSSPIILNSVFANNSAYFHGGAIYNLYDASPAMVHCTLYHNDSVYGGYGIYNVVSSSPVITNCIMWDNSSEEITNYDTSSVPIVTYSNIRGGYTGAGNIDAEPLLDTDLHLMENSPCIDAGNNAAVPSGITTDFDGDPRFLDDTGTPDTGTGTPPIVDMGADEFTGQSSSTGIIYVDIDAPGLHNGLSWTDAYIDLQDALTLADSGDDIRVAQGTYYPGTERTDSFSMKNGVTINGGYAGYGETDPDARDVAVYETVLSGDIGTPGDNSDNCYHVFYHPDGTDLDNTAVLDGFTITGGNAEGDGNHGYDGICGGMYNFNSSPTVINCVFFANETEYYGGGMYNVLYSSPVITGCRFVSNSAGYYGGGMYNDRSSPSVQNCHFLDNYARYHGGGICSVGICNGSSSDIRNCTFENNRAESGGGMYHASNSLEIISGCLFRANSGGIGVGMYNRNASPVLENCVFENNTGNGTSWGGGMFNFDNAFPVLTGCTFSSNSVHEGGGMYNYNSSPELMNCNFSGNTAFGGSGGGIKNHNSSPYVSDCTFSYNNASSLGGGMFNTGGSSPEIIQCSFNDNSAGEGGGINNRGSSPRIVNSLFYNNAAYTGCGICNGYNSTSLLFNSTFKGNMDNEGGYGGVICNLFSSPVITNCILWDDSEEEITNYDSSSIPIVTYSNIRGGYPGIGNIDIDPLLDATLHLMEYSPCIDAGDNTAVPLEILSDIDGDPRFLDDIGAPDTGVGTPPIVDMGADEFTGQSTGSGLLIVRTEGEGSIAIRYAPGSAELTAVPDPGWEFDTWSGDYACTDTPLTVVLNTDKTVIARFIEDIPGIEPVTVRLLDSTGQGIGGAEVKYYDGGWQEFGITGTDGSVTASIFTRQYKFRMYYGGASIDQTQDVSIDPTVVFRTVNVTVELRDSTGGLLEEGLVKYYAGGWQEIGATSGGQVSRELLPKSYKFRMYYGGASIDQTQDVSADSVVIFYTGKVLSVSGTCVKYYAGGWREFIHGMELLPKTYKFRFSDGTPDTNYSIQAGTENMIY